MYAWNPVKQYLFIYFGWGYNAALVIQIKVQSYSWAFGGGGARVALAHGHTLLLNKERRCHFKRYFKMEQRQTHYSLNQILCFICSSISKPKEWGTFYLITDEYFAT
jgi:hypothetical protein